MPYIAHNDPVVTEWGGVPPDVSSREIDLQQQVDWRAAALLVMEAVERWGPDREAVEIGKLRETWQAEEQRRAAEQVTV